MRSQDIQKTDIHEGSITFWILPGKIKFNDNEIAPLFQLNPPQGSLFILKDSDNKLKFFHVYVGKGRTDVEHDVSALDPNVKHMIAVTWSVKNRETILYVDGERVARSQMPY